MSPVLCSN